MHRGNFRGSPYRGRRSGRGHGRGRGMGTSREPFRGPSDAEGMKHPPHLKGRAIGMFYASRSQVRKMEAKSRPLGTVLLSESKKCFINSLLKNAPRPDTENMKSSWLYNEFLSNIHGRIDEKLELATSIKRDIQIDAALLKDYENKFTCSNYMDMQKYRRTLPSWKMMEELLNTISDNQVVVISGETGCGKTTQVSQFILDDHLKQGKGSACHVVCLQPRRISAIAVAERVAQERAEHLGNSCGYQIRLECELPRNRGSILFCTTGVLLRKMLSDPLLSNISHLIIDEIHERDINADFVIALMKKVIPKRPDLKLILMSATLNSDKFSRYFDNCPKINIPGFTFNVEEYYLEDVLEFTQHEFELNRRVSQNMIDREEQNRNDYIYPYIRHIEGNKKYSNLVCKQLYDPFSEILSLELILKLLKYICTTKSIDSGAILVFLPGFGEISSLIKSMEEDGSFSPVHYLIIPLHSNMATVDQKVVFDTPPKGKRKIIVSTNIAETSITINDIVYVIDCGYVKMTSFLAETNQQTLQSEFVSITNAKQRRGRAGRVRPGVCYHLFSRGREMCLQQFPIPAILRERLENVILMLKSLQLGDAHQFLETLLDSPNPESIDNAIRLLNRLEALDVSENLTPLGYHLSKLPMHPQIGKMILFGLIFGCLDPILSIAVSLEYKSPFIIPLGKEQLAEKCKLKLSRGIKSDHILYQMVLDEYQTCSNSGRFCWENFLSSSTLSMLVRMKRQYMDDLHSMKFVESLDSNFHSYNRNSENQSLIKAIVCAGLFPNIIIIIRKKKYSALYTESGSKLQFHKGSVMINHKQFETQLAVYYHRLKSTNDFIHDATMVYPLSVIFFGDRYRHAPSPVDGNTHLLSISDRLCFKCSVSTESVIRELRDRLYGYLYQKVLEPGANVWACEEDNSIVKAIIELITDEDAAVIDMEAFEDE